MTTTTAARPEMRPAEGARYRPPPRRRSWPLVGGGIAAALVGSVVAASVALSADRRQPVLVVARTIDAGRLITAGDLRTVRVGAEEGLPVVLSSHRASVVGRVAAVPLASGTLLQPAHLGATPDLASGEASVGVALEPGRFPPRLGAGDHVVAVGSPTGTGEGEPTELGSGVVTSVEPIGSGGSSGPGVIVGVRLRRDVAAPVAAAGAGRRLSSFFLLPPS